MPEPSEDKSVAEIIADFFNNLDKLPNIDPKVAKLVRDLWLDGNLNRDELLSVLEQMRSDQ